MGWGNDRWVKKGLQVHVAAHPCRDDIMINEGGQSSWQVVGLVIGPA